MPYRAARKETTLSLVEILHTCHFRDSPGRVRAETENAGINIRDRVASTDASAPLSTDRRRGCKVSLPTSVPLPVPGRCVGARPRPYGTIHPRRWRPKVATAPRPAHATCDTARHDGPRRPEHPAPRSTQISTQCCQLSVILPAPPHLPVLPHSAITGVAAEIRSSPVLHRKDSSVSRLMRGLIGIQADERTHRYPG